MPDIALRPLDLAPTCVNQGAPTGPDANAPGRTILQHVSCDGIPMTVEVEVFSPRSTAGPISAERRHLTRLGGAEDWSEAPVNATNGDQLRPWRVIRGSDPARVSVAGLWINGEPAAASMATRLAMARDSVFGGAAAPVLVVISPVADWAHVDMREKKALENRIAAALEARPEIGGQVRKIAEAAR
jgi:hypothetical protein